MGIFEDCSPYQRFDADEPISIPFSTSDTEWEDHSVWCVFDWDQRRVISVVTSWVEEDKDFIYEALMLHIDEIPPNVISIQIARDGELVSSTTNGEHDGTYIPFYPSITDYKPDTPYFRRPELVELDRLGVQVDLAVPKSDLENDSQRIVIKYYFTKNNISAIWHEANCLMRIPEHPNIVPFGRLIVDTVDGDDKVVGYSTPFIPGGTVLENVSRPFKLKYLRQLMDTVDFLNLELGVVHGDICTHNLLINPDTDNIQLFDFNMAAKLGWEGDSIGRAFEYEEDRNDVKFTIFTLYEVITRDAHFREECRPDEINPSMVVDLDTWEKHPDVNLDADVAEYRRVLGEWVASRRVRDQEVTHWTQASRFIDWPPVPAMPVVPVWGAMLPTGFQPRQELLKSGADFLKWQRPPTSELPLPEGQLLLATGQVIDGATGELVDRPEIAGLRYAIVRPRPSSESEVELKGEQELA